ncbi:glycerophosphodiester phosphodiesterase GDPD6-like [Hyposmocoma kahamanoa]|uniref:glycerophosphodiester phosphodiesterase GDPD6-like n=1 Tax=Hyposmocoma kahamanoa TaxID=1477025 RepID=UPI000E6D9AAA|nr:glycerophosphodiester phosphodiesterase GDPD6-like [Hyposmocoma kahamanoa]
MVNVIVYVLFACSVTTVHSAIYYSSPEKWNNRSPDLCKPLVIAHRGSSGYVPEHTLGAYALAITMGADYVEPDLVMSNDGFLVARHENELLLSTDVANRPEFATRYKTQTIDGRTVSGWFTEDFTLQELKMLRSKEVIGKIRPGNTRMDGAFDIPTFQEIIDLVKAMEISERRIIGICPELKHPTHFQQLNLGMEKAVVDQFHENGYVGADSAAYIQSFEVSNLRELKNLTDIKLIQLMGNSSRQPFDQVLLGTGLTYGDMATAEGLRNVATYAYAVGPDKSHVIPRVGNNLGVPTSYVANAHAAGLKVHPYTFRAENFYLPYEFRSNDSSIADIGNMRGELQVFLATGIDGFFTDQPDVAVQMRGSCKENVRPNSGTRISALAYNLLIAYIIHKVLCHKV